MAFYTVYDNVSGERRSLGTLEPDPDVLQAGNLGVLETAFKPWGDPSKQWNPATRVYDDVTPPKAPITRQDFIDRFEPDERENLTDAEDNHANANVRKKIRGFFRYVSLSDRIFLDNTYIVTSVNAMESFDLIGAGRAAEILA